MTTFSAVGWTLVADLMTKTETAQVLAACHQLLSVSEDERRIGDKPHAGTHHLVDLEARCDLVDEIVQRASLMNVVAELLGEPFEPMQVSYRSPQPGFGAQKLHTDAVPKLDSGPDEVATAIVPLVDFTATNGPTRVVPGSHSRPDLQRLGGNLDSHVHEQQLLGPAGCAFVFSGHLLHSGTRNESDAERPALQLQWARSSTTAP